jgi:hypothetical protein
LRFEQGKTLVFQAVLPAQKLLKVSITGLKLPVKVVGVLPFGIPQGVRNFLENEHGSPFSTNFNSLTSGQ